MATTTKYTGTLELYYCASCGVPFGLERNYAKRAREERTTWRCPNGHSQWFPGKTDEQLRKEAEAKLEDARRRIAATRELLHAEERSHSATRGHVTRKKRELARAKAGVCPVDGCHRHFQNLGRHMKTKHPDYTP